MDTLVMVRTICCESHKGGGARCVNCPHLLENQEALDTFRMQESQISAGRARSCEPALMPAGPQPISRTVLPRAC